jgi:predicted regulator of Ras-like GTPase activity (Roadblock/LC7/MglB family)
MTKKKRSFQDVTDLAEPIATEEAIPVNDLKTNIEEIKTWDGVIGYILRNSNSAAIDLKDPTKIIDYAILSSSALEASEKLCKLFNLGEVKDIVVEGKNAKVLSLTVEENKISIFLERNADHEKILKKLR